MIDTIGVASFNVYRHLPRGKATRDALRLTSERAVDVVGWQETRASYFPDVRDRLARRRLADVWQEVPGDLVVGTGDFNFDFRDDHRARPEGGIWRSQRGHATSSYDVLGLAGVEPTRGSRWIDYVWIADHTLRRRADDPGSGQFVRHRSLDGYASDHRPLVARIRWYDR